MVFGVGDVECFAVQRAALWVIKRSCLKIAVRLADIAAANGLDQLAVERGNDDAVVVTVADKEAIALLVGQYFASPPEVEHTNTVLTT